MRDAVSPPSFGKLPTYLEGREGVVSRIADIAARMGVTQDYAQKYRRRLLDAGVIEQVRRGYVRYAVPYLDSYLRRG